VPSVEIAPLTVTEALTPCAMIACESLPVVDTLFAMTVAFPVLDVAEMPSEVPPVVATVPVDVTVALPLS